MEAITSLLPTLVLHSSKHRVGSHGFHALGAPSRSSEL